MTRKPDEKIVKAGLDEFFYAISEDGEIYDEMLFKFKKLDDPIMPTRIYEIKNSNYAIIPTWDELYVIWKSEILPKSKPTLAGTLFLKYSNFEMLITELKHCGIFASSKSSTSQNEANDKIFDALNKLNQRLEVLEEHVKNSSQKEA